MIGEINAPKLTDIQKITKPASIRVSFSGYKRPTIFEILGFIKPDPIIIKNIDENKPNKANGKLKQICPIIISTAPNKVAPRVPVILSAIHAPGIEDM